MSGAPVITVDGPAASGKGTIASGLGRQFGLPVLDSGLLYRAVGVLLEREGGDLDDAAAASRVAVHPQVREVLLQLQRAFAAQAGGAVLDGRDMGTVICPDAGAKLYVTARPEVRAERRWRQLTGQGESVSLDEVLADIHRRDARDSGREAAPMRPAADAALLDTSEMTIEQAADAARRIVEAARARQAP